MSKRKSFQVPTKFKFSVVESDFQNRPSGYHIEATSAFVDLTANGQTVSIPRRVFKKLVEFYQSEVEPNFKRL